MSLIKTIDVKGSRIDDLTSLKVIHPLKARQHYTKSLDSCRRVSGNTLERLGVAFSIMGALVIALPASGLNTFTTNGLFLVGDIFLLSLFIRELRIYLIVQNLIFAILAFIGVVVNFPGGIL
jgi:hypothetical protein